MIPIDEGYSVGTSESYRRVCNFLLLSTGCNLPGIFGNGVFADEASRYIRKRGRDMRPICVRVESKSEHE